MKFIVCATFVAILAINFDGIQGAPQLAQDDVKSPPPNGPGSHVIKVVEGTGEIVLDTTGHVLNGGDRLVYALSGRRTPRFGFGGWTQDALQDTFQLGNLTAGELLTGLDKIIDDIHKGDIHGAVDELLRIAPEAIHVFLKSLGGMFEPGRSLDFHRILRTISAYITPFIPACLLPHLGSILTIVLVIFFSLSIRL